jgi:hypothetical protein
MALESCLIHILACSSGAANNLNFGDAPMKRLLPSVIAVLFVSMMGWSIPPANAADAKIVRPFNGKDLSGWKFQGKESKWVVGRAELDPKNPSLILVKPGSGEMINKSGGHGVDIYTEDKFGDCTIELEFMVPRGSNSGVYVMGEYEIQILDSYGRKKVNASDLGGLYGAAAPRVNAAKAPGEWQKFVIDFQAPRFDGDKRTAKAKFLKVVLNDEVIHENVEMNGATPGGLKHKEAATGPLMFQGNHGAVAVRNIKITLK